MIKGNVIYMGYGDILIGNRLGCELNFKQTEEVFPVGVMILPREVTIQKIARIESNRKDLMKLNTRLEKIYNKKDKTVSLGNYILDFNNFNSSSVENLQRNIKQALERR